MAIIARYEFNQELYSNLLPEFNSEFTNYTVTDVDNGNSTVYQISGDKIEKGFIDGNGNSADHSEFTRIKDYFEVESGRTYVFSPSITLIAYDNNRKFVSVHDISWMTECKYTVPYGVKYIRFYKNTSVDNFTITLKSTTTRTIESSSYPTKMIFGFSGGNVTDKQLALLKMLSYDASYITTYLDCFAQCYNLSEVCNIAVNINTTSLVTMFYYCYSLKTINVGHWDVSQVKNMNGMFQSCSLITKLAVDNWKVNNVTDMSGLFRGCTNLTTVNVSKWDTSSNTSMRDMFRECKNINNLDVSNFKTSKVTNVGGMFLGCTELEYLNVSNWDTGNFSGLYQTFYGCGKLKYLDVSKWNTSNVQTLQEAFINCNSLTSLNVSKWDVSNCKTINQAFSGCHALKKLDVSNWNTSNITNAFQCFSNCRALEKLEVQNWDISQITSISEMFIGCSTLKELDLSKWNTSNCTHFSGLFSGCTSLISVGNINNWDTSNVTIMSGVFKNCSKITKLELLNWDTSSVTTMDSCFRDCTKLETLLISTWDTKNVANFGNMFRDCTSLTKLNISNFDLSNATVTSNMLGSCPNLTVYINKNKFNDEVRTTASSATIFKEFDGQIVVQYTYLNTNYPSINPKFNGGGSYNYSFVDEVNGNITTRTITSESLPTQIQFYESSTNMGYGDIREIYEINTRELTTTQDMFRNNYALQKINYFNVTNKVIDMSHVFGGCTSLTEIPTPHLWDTSSNTSFQYSFSSCQKITSLDTSSWKTSNVKYMIAAFSGCKMLKELDLSTFDTSSVTNMSDMLQNCNSLESIKLENLDTSKVSTFYEMFQNCSLLKTLNLSKWNTSSCTNMGIMFSGCSSLENLYISNFNTKKTNNMTYMFRHCNSLKILDLSSFDTSSVGATHTDMFLDVPQQTIVYTNGNTWNIDTSSYNATFVTLGGKLLTAYKFNTLTHSDVLPAFNSGFGSGAYGIHDIDTHWKKTYDTNTWVMGALNSATGAETTSVNYYRSDFIEVTPTVKYSLGTNYNMCWYDINKTFIRYDENSTNPTAPNNARYVRVFTRTKPSTFILQELYVVTRALSVGVDYPTVVRFGQLWSENEVIQNSTLALLEVLHLDTHSLTSIQGLFRRCSNLVNVDCSCSWNTSQIIDMKAVFQQCSQLTRIDVSNFDTSNVTMAHEMFATCVGIEYLDVSKWDTKNITRMDSMFAYCAKLKDIDVSNWDTHQVTNMTCIFASLPLLINIDVSKWDTSSCTNTSQMFAECKLLEAIDVSSWDVSKVKNMELMFKNCAKVTRLDVENWDVSNVVYFSSAFIGSGITSFNGVKWDVSTGANIHGMFAYCSSLTDFNAPNWKLSSCTATSSMFEYCTALETLDLSGWDVSQVKTMDKMFGNCTKLKNISLLNWDTSSVVSFNSMFDTCESLTELDLSHFNTSSATNMYGVFSKCKKLEKVNLLNWDTKNVTDIGYMFNHCQSLKELDLRHFDTSNVLRMHWTFCMCQNLTKLDVSTWDTRKTVNFLNTFERCQALTELDLSSFSTNQATQIEATFFECSNLETLDISNFHFGGVSQNINNKMFMNCKKLKRVAMIYCRASSFSTLANAAFTGSNSPSIIVYYHDANLSDLPSVSNVTYEYYDIQSVTLPYELNKLPDGVADYIDVVNGVYVQRVGKKVFDGSTDEVWNIGKYANFEANNECTIFASSIKDKKDNYNHTKLCDKWALNTTEITTIANIEGIHVGGNADSFFINVSNSTATTVDQWRAYLQSNPFTYMYELKTPIYTPLTEEEKALLPLTVYAQGNIMMSSDELRPSKFEFRAKSSNRMQLDMLETGHYYLDAPTGNIKLGNVDIDVTEMPCLIKVDNASDNRLVVNSADFFCKEILLNYEEGYLDVLNGTVNTEYVNGRWVSDFVEIPYHDKSIYIMNDTELADVCYYDENKNFVSGMAIGNVNSGREIHLTGNTTVKYMRFSGKNSERVINLRSHLITLSKLPSHRIPTTFTQGMKSSVDFGYWEGSKEAKGTSFRTNKVSDGSNVDSCNIYNGTGIVLNRVVLDGKIIEDELDISTGKYIKRIEKVIINGSENWTQNTGGTAFVNANSHYTTLSKRSSGYDCCSDKLKFRAYWSADEPRVWIDGRQRLVVHLPFGVSYNTTVLKQYLSENPITVYYQLETPEISYIDLPKNVLKTAQDATYSILWTTTGYLVPQVKPSPLSYPTTLSPNTQYTVFHNRKNYNGSVKTPMINLGGTEVSATGSRTVVTTPSTLAHNELQFIGGENTVEQVMVLHGDWTKQGKTVDYFEGLQSSIIGDKTLENLVGEPDVIWATPNNGDHVHVDDIIAKYAPSVPKLPEVQVGGQITGSGMTLHNLASLSSITKGAGELTAGQSKIGCSYNLKNNMLKIGGQYTVICEIKVNSNTNTFIYNELFGRNSSGGGLSHGLTLCKANETGTFRKVSYISSFHPEALTTDGMSGYVACRTEDKTQPASYDIELLSIIILEGDYTNIDIPYFEGMKSVENPVYHSVGKNLFPTNNYIECGTDNRMIGQYIYNIYLQAGNYRMNHFHASDSDVDTSLRFEIIDENDNEILILGSTYRKFTLEKDGLYTFVFGRGSSYNNTHTKVQIQLELGETSTSYEPYKENILSAPQGTVLRGVGNYVDRLSYNDGIIRRNCVEFTISGEEGYEWRNVTESTNTVSAQMFWDTLGLKGKIVAGSNVGICDKLSYSASPGDFIHWRIGSGDGYSTAFVCYLDKTKFSTYTSQGINDYIKSIGGLTIIAPLINTEYEQVQLTGGGNWNKVVLDETKDYIYNASASSTTNGLSIFHLQNLQAVQGETKNIFSDKLQVINDSIPFSCRKYVDGSQLVFVLPTELAGTTNTSVKQYLQENPITVWYQSTSNTITNTDPLLFNHGAVYTETDCLPTTLNNFSLKTTNRRPIKDMSTLKYTILTDKEFRFNNVTYAPSSTGMTIVDVTTIADTYMYSDDDMVTVVQDDGNYYADGVLTQFKGEKTFIKEFIRTSNDTYNTGMTLLEPLELRGIRHLGAYDTYNPITGELSKTIREIMLTADEVKALNISINSTNNSFGGCTIYFALTTDGVQHNANPHTPLVNTNYGAMKVDVATYGTGRLDFYFHYDSSYGTMTVDSFKEMITEDFIMVYMLATPQTIQANPTSTYISTRPENGNIVAQDTQIQAEYLNYDNEQSIISPRMLGDGDEIRWEQGSQCYVYENDNEYIPLTEYNELFGANLQAQEYTQYAESVDGANIEVGVALKEKAVYEQTYVKYEDNVIYPETMENLDETNGVEVDYICGATWQNPDDLSDIRHLGTLREDGQYDVTIRRSGDDEIRLLEGTTHIGLDYDVLPPSEFELTFFNSGGVEVGKYGDTTHVLEDCVENSKLASGTVYGQTLVNLIDFKANSYQSAGSVTSRGINTITFKTNNTGKFNIGCTVDLKPSAKYCIKANIQSTNSITFRVCDVKANYYPISETIPANGEYIGTFTASSYATTGQVTFYRGTTVGEETITGTVTLIEYIDGCENWLEHFEGINSTVVNGFSSCGKNLWTSDGYGSYYTAGHAYVLNGYKPTYPLTLSSTTQRCVTKGISVKPNSYYTISITDYDRDTSEYYLIVSFYRTEKDGMLDKAGTPTFVIATNGSMGASKTIKTPTDCNYVVCGFAINYTYEQNGGEIVLYEEPKIQFEIGQTQTSYELPRKVNHTLPTPITLRKVGDVCDTFDVVSGVETRNVSELTFNGSENWDAIFNSSSSVFKLTLPSIKANSPLLIKNGLVDGIISIAFENNVLVIQTTANFASISVNVFKDKLKDNPITIYAQPANPQTTKHTLIPSTTQTTQEPTFILPQPLRSVPNGICDRLYWDENKGHYCIEKRVEVLEINGTFDWSQEHLNSTHIGVYSYSIKTNTYSQYYSSLSYYFKCYPSTGHNANDGREKITYVGNGSIKVFIATDKLTEPTPAGVKQWFTENPTTYYRAQEKPEIIDLPHLDKKVELPTQPDISPIGYKAVHEKANPEIGLTIPYKVLNMPTQPVNLNFVMDIADYVLTWDDVKEARQYNIILNDEVIATVKEPQYNTGEEMYGYILVEANNEIGDNLSEELYIKTVPNAPAQLTVAHNPQTDFYDFEISFIDTSNIADYYTVMYKVDNGEWVINTIQNSELTTGEKHLWSFSVYEIKESIEVWATATNDVGTNDILPTAVYYMSPTPQWTYRINSKDVFLRWLDESPYDTKYKLRYSYKSNGQFQYAYFEGDAAEIGKLYEAVLPLAEDDEVTLALCIVSEKENLYCKPVKASKPLDPNIVPPMNFNYHWLARGLIEFYWQDQYDVDVEYEYILESMKANETLWTQVNEIIPSADVEGIGTIYRVEYQLEDLEQIRMKVRMKWAMNETEWTETLTTVFIPVEGNPPTYIRRTQTAEGLLIEWEAQAYIDSYHIYVTDNETGEELQHLETQDNSILVDLDYSNSIEIAIYEISRFSGGIESDPTDPMVFTPTMFATDIDQRIYQPCTEEYPIEVSTVQKATKQPYVIHDVSYTPNVMTKHDAGVSIATPFLISYHPMMVDVHQAGSRSEATINAHIKTLNTRNEDAIRVMTFERITDVYDMDFRVYTPSVASYPINLEISKVRIVCLGDSLTSGHPFYWAETGTGDITASYPYQLSRRLKNQYEVINSGYGSDTTDRCLARFDKDVLRYQPQYCIFQCGTND